MYFDLSSVVRRRSTENVLAEQEICSMAPEPKPWKDHHLTSVYTINDVDQNRRLFSIVVNTYIWGLVMMSLDSELATVFKADWTSWMEEAASLRVGSQRMPL